jgi:hypothetical protein
MQADALHRVAALRAWLTQIAVVRDDCHPLGQAARRKLPSATGLSPRNVEWALAHSLELQPTVAQLEALVNAVPTCDTAHVLLSANLFTASLRAIAIAKAAAKRVVVRPSRRDSLFTELLHRAAPDAFELADDLSPQAGDHAWAYGSDETISDLCDAWPEGVILHAHGHGYGLFVAQTPATLSDADFALMALDVAAFDQRGCLSPRVVLVQGDSESATCVAHRLFAALERIEREIPLGRLTDAETEARLRYRTLAQYMGVCLESRAALVSVNADDTHYAVPPSGRVVQVCWTDQIESTLRQHGRDITCIGTTPDGIASLQALLPLARVVPFGWMQRPPLDGPADRRTDPRGVVLPPRSQRAPHTER